MPRLTGLVAATYTPMRADGSLHLDQVGPMVDYLVRQGVTGLFVCGSTGEGPSLSTEERQETATATVQATAKRIPVVVHVGHCSLTDSRRLAEHAQKIGADAISAVSPWYFKPASVANLVDCLAEMAKAAPGLPFYYYHIPMLTGVSLDVVELLRQAGERLPTLSGVKYTAPTIDEYQTLLNFDGGRYDVLFGRDEMLLSALVIGCRGAIGTTYNFAAPIYRRVMDAFDRGDLADARKHQADAVALIRLLLKRGGLSVFKGLMSLLGIDCGPVRLPLVSATAEEIGRIRAELDELGFFRWIEA